mmetsp:Transcript_56873/g.100479  ORF Transcript_56873/g.100479 Transcript_56873/m.100479 type:complete len:108 (+) Transcript_56873:166-489(+)
MHALHVHGAHLLAVQVFDCPFFLHLSTSPTCSRPMKLVLQSVYDRRRRLSPPRQIWQSRVFFWFVFPDARHSSSTSWAPFCNRVATCDFSGLRTTSGVVHHAMATLP